jgi:hypothetical protein
VIVCDFVNLALASILPLRLKYEPMKWTFCATFLLFTMSAVAQNTGAFDTKAAQRFANLALACVYKESPNVDAIDICAGRRPSKAICGTQARKLY